MSTRPYVRSKEIGAVKAAEKLGITNHQTLGSWVRYSKKVDENQEFRELESLRAEVIFSF